MNAAILWVISLILQTVAMKPHKPESVYILNWERNVFPIPFLGHFQSSLSV